MYLGTKKQADIGIVPLQNAVVCVDCQSITEGNLEQCPICGSASLLNFGRILGSALPLHKMDGSEADTNAIRFDLEFTIDLKQMELKDLNAAIQHITGLIGPRLMRGRAHCHISVEPTSESTAGETAA